MRKHTCGYPIKTTEKCQHRKNCKGIYYDDNPEKVVKVYQAGDTKRTEVEVWTQNPA